MSWFHLVDWWVLYGAWHQGKAMALLSACELQASCVAISWGQERTEEPTGQAQRCPLSGGSVESQTGKCQAYRPSKCKCLTALEFSFPGGEKRALIYEVKCHNTLQHITSQHAATWSWHLFALIPQNSFYLEQMFPVNSNSSHFPLHSTCQFPWGQLFSWSFALCWWAVRPFQGF